jgi:hypothetical protein
MNQRVPEYVGQVEKDSSGALWAVLYSEGQVLRREQVRSLRQGKRMVTDLVLAAADAAARADSIARMRGSGVPRQPKSPGVEAIDPDRRRQSGGRLHPPVPTAVLPRPVNPPAIRRRRGTPP